MAIFKGIATVSNRTSRTARRVGTKSKVLEPRKGPKGPYPKSRFSRAWKQSGQFRRTAVNPLFIDC